MHSTQKRSGSYLIILTLWLLVFATNSQLTLVPLILPRIAEELTVSESALGLLMTVYGLAVGIFALIAGPISDRIGRRRILAVGSGFLALSLGLHEFADTFGELLVMRGLSGAARGILSGALISYIRDYFPGNRQGWATGWVMSGVAAAQIIGVPLGTLLAHWFGFRIPFLAFSAVSGLAFLLILFFLPQPDVKMSESLSVRSALKSYADLLRRKEVRAAAAAFLTMFAAQSAFITFFPLWLEKDLQFTPHMVALLFMIAGVANALVAPQAGKLSDRIYRTRVITVSCICAALLMPLNTLVALSVFWLIYPLTILLRIFETSQIIPLQTLTTGLQEGEHRGKLMSLVTTIGQVGFSLGSLFASASWGRFGLTGNALIAMVSLLLMAAVVWRFLVPVERQLIAEKSQEI